MPAIAPAPRRTTASKSQPLVRWTDLFGVAFAVLLTGGCAATEAVDDEHEHTHQGEWTEVRESSVFTGTVEAAVTAGCQTGLVKGLSFQIIEEGACIDPDAYAKLPDRPNLTLGPNAYPYLIAPARDALVASLDANPGKHMHVNSMLRTVAQQYLLKRWSQKGICGIGLAATPGNSNHETGLAIDTNDASSWKGVLPGFKWFGSKDPVHFDYVGPGAVSQKGLDVLAFQRLHNRNHPEDPITEDGDWGPQTQARMKQAPAAGFPIGAICNSTDDGGGAGGNDGGSSGGGDDGGSSGGGDAGAPACAHDLCSTGPTLAPECSSCVAAICNVDPFCCFSSWDSLCVEEVTTICAAQNVEAPVCGMEG